MYGMKNLLGRIFFYYCLIFMFINLVRSDFKFFGSCTNLAIVIVQTYSMPIFHCPWLCRFPVCFNLFVLLFLVTPCLIVAVQPCMEKIPIKKNWFLNFFPPFFLFSFIFLLNICTSSSHSSSVLFLMFLSVNSIFSTI